MLRHRDQRSMQRFALPDGRRLQPIYPYCGAQLHRGFMTQILDLLFGPHDSDPLSLRPHPTTRAEHLANAQSRS
jgi:hypothetical protein